MPTSTSAPAEENRRIPTIASFSKSFVSPAATAVKQFM